MPVRLILLFQSTQVALDIMLSVILWHYISFDFKTTSCNRFHLRRTMSPFVVYSIKPSNFRYVMYQPFWNAIDVYIAYMLWFSINEGFFWKL